jgi:deazaflavin-dependent oxidoreductase (nitroreductase family)
MASNLTERLQRVASTQTLRLTHHGRKSGKPYEVTIWFIVDGDKILLPTANITRQWVRNVRKTPHVMMNIGGEMFSGEARFLDDAAERDRVFGFVRTKYWMFLPAIAIGQILTSLGIVKDNTGAFEVTIAQT